jgi:hypothetical protein
MLFFLSKSKRNKLKGHMQNQTSLVAVSTISLVEAVCLTLEVSRFVNEAGQLDGVSRRQCLLRAVRELCSPRVLALHEPKKVRLAISALQAAL